MRAEGQQRDGEVFRGVWGSGVQRVGGGGRGVQLKWSSLRAQCSSLRAHPPGPVIAPVGAPGGYPSAGCFSNRSIA